MSNVFTVNVLECTKYRLRSNLPCSAKPNKAYASGRQQQIEAQTGLQYINKMGPNYSWFGTHTWDTELPAGLVIQILRYFHRNMRVKPTLKFKVTKQDNPGWPVLMCIAPLSNFDKVIMETL